MGRVLHSVIAAPVTSTIRGLSTEVQMDADDGLRVVSVANLDNVQLIGRSRLVRRIGHAGRSTMSDICDALSIAVGCDQ